jgi:single-strand DNA-binding protein
MNKAILIGNLTKKPELTQTTGGLAVAKFTLAVQRKFKNDKGEFESDFVNCVAWRQTAEFAEKYFDKGEKIAVTGSIQTRSYDNQEGKKVYVTEVVADEVEKLVWNKEDNAGQKRTKQDSLQPLDDDSSLPF